MHELWKAANQSSGFGVPNAGSVGWFFLLLDTHTHKDGWQKHWTRSFLAATILSCTLLIPESAHARAQHMVAQGPLAFAVTRVGHWDQQLSRCPRHFAFLTRRYFLTAAFRGDLETQRSKTTSLNRLCNIRPRILLWHGGDPDRRHSSSVTQHRRSCGAPSQPRPGADVRMYIHTNIAETKARSPTIWVQQ